MVGQQMNAPAEVIQFDLPKRPKIELKQAPPDRRTVAVVPIRAVFDKQLTHGGLQALAALCAYCNKAGVTWVSQLRLASELGISQQALAKQYRQLKRAGLLGGHAQRVQGPAHRYAASYL
jgi:hypothetical protein